MTFKIEVVKGFIKQFILIKKWMWASRKILLQIFLVLSCIRLLFFGFYLWTTKTFYYLHNFQKEVLTERRYVKAVSPETKLQAYIRIYFSGSYNYSAKIPFGGVDQIIGVYHDDGMKSLIINWEIPLVQNWQEALLDKDIELFLLSIKDNFPVENIRFLVEGNPAGLKWRDYSFDIGIPLNQINFNKK